MKCCNHLLAVDMADVARDRSGSYVCGWENGKRCRNGNP